MSNTSLLGSFGGQAGDALMFRNRIINGDMRIDQRAAGVSQAITLASVQYLSVDRFLSYQTGVGSTGTIGQVSINDLMGFTNAQRYTVSSITDPTAVTVGQRIEGFNIADLANQQVTVSFYIKASRSVNIAIQLYKPGTPRSWVKTIPTTTTWVRQSVTLTLETLNSSVNGNALEVLFRYRPDSSSLTATEGSWVDGDKSGITGTTYDFGNTQNDWIEVTGVQLEAGPTATPFERRPYSVELSMAMRYYQKIDLEDRGIGISPSVIYKSQTLFVPLRATATATVTWVDGIGTTNTGDSGISPNGSIRWRSAPTLNTLGWSYWSSATATVSSEL